jgi:uncharacterized protein (TIGR03086 family)
MPSKHCRTRGTTNNAVLEPPWPLSFSFRLKLLIAEGLNINSEGAAIVPTNLLESAIASTRVVLERVDASQMRDPTPCEQWNVSQLINHIVGEQFYFLGVLAGEIRTDKPIDFSKGKFLKAFDDGSNLCVEAFGHEGVMSEILTLPSTEITGFSFVRVAATDIFVHGWDLARATGQSTDLSPDLAAKLLVAAKIATPPIMRSVSGSPFAPERASTIGSSEADQLAAYLGRRF